MPEVREHAAFNRNHPLDVIPAQAGIYGGQKHGPSRHLPWVPAFAGTTRGGFRAALLTGLLALALQFCGAFPVKADRIQNSVAMFAALDKVTGGVKPLEVRIGQTATFGALKVTPRACYTRPATETPLTSAFIEVDELLLDGSAKRIFTGWTFAESPGLHAVEHPTFDIWLTSCKMPVEERSIGRRPNSPRP